MSKSENLVLILNLLFNRRCVDITTIQRECDVSARTAYRYVRSLEGIGFPVYFDQDYGGYRLVIRPAKVGQFAPVEAAILILALDLLENSISPNTIEAIKRIRLKLESSIPKSEQVSLYRALDRSLLKCGDGQTRNHILLTLIDYAQRLGRKVRLVHAADAHANSVVAELQPCLRFDRGWRVEGTNASGETASIPIGSIMDLELV